MPDQTYAEWVRSQVSPAAWWSMGENPAMYGHYNEWLLQSAPYQRIKEASGLRSLDQMAKARPDLAGLIPTAKEWGQNLWDSGYRGEGSRGLLAENGQWTNAMNSPDDVALMFLQRAVMNNWDAAQAADPQKLFDTFGTDAADIRRDIETQQKNAKQRAQTGMLAGLALGGLGLAGAGSIGSAMGLGGNTAAAVSSAVPALLGASKPSDLLGSVVGSLAAGTATKALPVPKTGQVYKPWQDLGNKFMAGAGTTAQGGGKMGFFDNLTNIFRTPGITGKGGINNILGQGLQAYIKNPKSPATALAAAAGGGMVGNTGIGWLDKLVKDNPAVKGALTGWIQNRALNLPGKEGALWGGAQGLLGPQPNNLWGNAVSGYLEGKQYGIDPKQAAMLQALNIDVTPEMATGIRNDNWLPYVLGMAQDGGTGNGAGQGQAGGENALQQILGTMGMGGANTAGGGLLGGGLGGALGSFMPLLLASGLFNKGDNASAPAPAASTGAAPSAADVVAGNRSAFTTGGLTPGSPSYSDINFQQALAQRQAEDAYLQSLQRRGMTESGFYEPGQNDLRAKIAGEADAAVQARALDWANLGQQAGLQRESWANQLNSQRESQAAQLGMNREAWANQQSLMNQQGRANLIGELIKGTMLGTNPLGNLLQTLGIGGGGMGGGKTITNTPMSYPFNTYGGFDTTGYSFYNPQGQVTGVQNGMASIPAAGYGGVQTPQELMNGGFSVDPNLLPNGGRAMVDWNPYGYSIDPSMNPYGYSYGG